MTLFFYLSRDILKTALAVSLVLLLIVSSGRLAKYLSQASSGDLAPELVFSIILFRLPDFLPLILPLGVFVGVMLVFGRLYIEGEMAALFASGVGKLRIAIYTLIPAFLVSVFVAFLTLWAAPQSLSKVESLLAQSRSSHSLMLFREGKFNNNRDGSFTAYIGKITSDSSLQRIFLIEQELLNTATAEDSLGAEPSLGRTTLMVAESGKILPGSDDEERLIEVETGRVYESRADGLDYRVTEFDSYRQRVRLERGSEERKLKIDTLTTEALLDGSGSRIEAALHWRFSLPATVIVVAILALGMSQTDPRRGRYARMLPAILIYLIYIVSLSATRSLIEDDRLPVLSLWLLHGVYFFAALLAYFLPDIQRRRANIPPQLVAN